MGPLRLESSLEPCLSLVIGICRWVGEFLGGGLFFNYICVYFSLLSLRSSVWTTPAEFITSMECPRCCLPYSQPFIPRSRINLFTGTHSTQSSLRWSRDWPTGQLLWKIITNRCRLGWENWIWQRIVGGIIILLLPRVMDDLQKHRQDINSLESHPLWQSLLLEGSLLVSSCGLQVFGGWRRKSCTTTKMRGRCRLKSALLMQPHECIYQIRCGCANKCRHVLVSQLIE